MRILTIVNASTALVGLLLLAPSAWAADAQEAFESLFGPEARKVAATPDRSDDAAFAAKLLSAADELKDAPDVRVLLYQKACEFGLHAPAGYATAEKALAGLDAVAPDRKADTEDKRLELLQAQYRDARVADKSKAADALITHLLEAGNARAQAEKYTEAMALYRRAQGLADAVRSDRKDDVLARIREATPRAAAEQQLATLKSRLAAAPDDAAAAEAIVRVYLVDLDNPAAAATYADKIRDETRRKYLLVAAMKLENLPEKACLALGDWYVELAGPPTATAHGPMLRRAHAYYEKYLALHLDEDADRLRATAALVKVTRDLEGPGTWVDVLKLIDPAKDAAAGTWKVAAGLLASDESAPALLRLPYQPPEEYDVQIVFARTAGSGDVGILLQKAGAQFEWIMDVGGKYCGFETVGGERAGSPKNRTSFAAILRNNQRYTVLVQVRNSGLKATVEGQTVAELKTDYKNLATFSSFAIPGTKCLGLITWSSGVTFQSVRVLEVSGKGKVGRDPPPKPEDQGTP